MTGYIVKTFRDRIEIASDTATYSPEGVVIGFHDKVRISEAIPLAIMGSGAVPMIDMVVDLVLQAASVTCSVNETVGVVAKALESTRAAIVQDSPFRIGIAAISETAGPTSYVFTMFDEPGIEISRLVEKPRGFGMGCLPDDAKLLELGLTGMSLEADAPKLFEHMRRVKMPTPGQPDRAHSYKIGGSLILTMLTAHGYQQRELKRWSDVIGEKIDPFKDEAVTA